MNTDKQLFHVYLMPGMAVDSSIFENLDLPEDRFKIHYLEWEIPEPNENLEHYVKKLLKKVKHESPVLIGVSFGGVIVQEMARYISIKRLIIISSVKCHAELPPRMKFFEKTGLYKLIPVGLANYVDYFEKVAVGDFLNKRAKLYRKYLSVSDKKYLNWAIRNMLKWDCNAPGNKLIHIHGSKDEVFPIKNIQNCIVVPEGTHIMIVNRFRWFNENLPEIIETGKLKEAEQSVNN